MAGFSSHGAGVDLLAPGYNILSAHLDGSLAVMSGTSQAAAVVVNFPTKTTVGGVPTRPRSATTRAAPSHGWALPMPR